MAARAADLPQALVGLVPVRLDEVDEGPLERPGVPLVPQAGAAGQVEGVHHLAVDVELALAVRRCVADAHGRGALVAGQPAAARAR